MTYLLNNHTTNENNNRTLILVYSLLSTQAMSPLNDKQVKCMWKYRVMQTYDKHKVYEAVKVGRGPAGCNKLMHVHNLLLWLSWEGVKILNAFCKRHVHGAQKRHQIFSITHIDTFVIFKRLVIDSSTCRLWCKVWM